MIIDAVISTHICSDYAFATDSVDRGIFGLSVRSVRSCIHLFVRQDRSCKHSILWMAWAVSPRFSSCISS